MQYYVAKNDQQLGPFSESEIHSGLNDGQFRLSDLIWREGISEWTQISTLFPKLKTNTAHSTPPPIPRMKPPISPPLVQGRNEIWGTIACLLSFVGTMLNIFWIGNMNLLDDPESKVGMVLLFVVVGSAVTIAIEAAHLGIGGSNDHEANKLRAKGIKVFTGPITWAVLTLLLWIVYYPYYLYYRSKYRLKNLVGGGILGTILLLLSAVFITDAIESKRAEVRQELQNVKDELDKGVQTLMEDLNEDVEVEARQGWNDNLKHRPKSEESKQEKKFYSVSEPFKLDNHQYVIHSVQKHFALGGNTLENMLGNMLAQKFQNETDSTVYAIVEFSIRNEGRKAESFYIDNIKIKDAKNRIYAPSTEESIEIAGARNEMIILPDGTITSQQVFDPLAASPYIELQPGLSHRSVQVFKMPKGAFDDGLSVIVEGKSSLVEIRIAKINDSGNPQDPLYGLAKMGALLDINSSNSKTKQVPKAEKIKESPAVKSELNPSYRKLTYQFPQPKEIQFKEQRYRLVSFSTEDNKTYKFQTTTEVLTFERADISDELLELIGD